MNIENKKQLATILLAVGLGLVASMLMSKVVNDKIDEQTRVIAKEYQIKSADLVKEIDTTRRELKKLTQEHRALEKKVAQQPKVIQQPVHVKKEEKPSIQKVAFSLRTPPGKRALTLRINSLAAVGGLVNPGDFVDVIASLDVPEEVSPKQEGQDKVVTVLFQNIQVLAVGTNYDPVGEAPPYELQQQSSTLNVTFAVNPEEAGLLTFAQANGDLRLSLRSPAETQNRILQQVASWDALADFVLERQGTDLFVPRTKTKDSEEKTEEVQETEEEVKPYIQIFRGGREL